MHLGLPGPSCFRNVAKSNRNTPNIIATSAILKIPVQIGPIPTLRKSTTVPSCNMRSIKLLTPPAINNDIASIAEKVPDFDKRAKINAPKSIKQVATVNIACLKKSGS
jgi:hypothetical protein